MENKKTMLHILVITIICIISITLIPIPTLAAKSKNSSFSTKLKVKGVKAESKTQNQIKIRWKSIKDVTGYQIYRSTSKKGKYTKAGTTKKSYFTNKKLKAGKKYYYKIRAYKKKGRSRKYSRFSSVICIKTLKSGRKATGTGTSTTTKNNTAEIPGTTEENSTTEKNNTEIPATTEKNTATEKPTTTENSTATETPTTTENSTATEAPATTEESTTEDIPEMPQQYTQNLNYDESTERINNPDQGFYQHISVNVKETGINYDPSVIKSNDQLYHLRINIGNFSEAKNQTADKELTAPALIGIECLLKDLNKHNKNAIVRFAYDYDGKKNQEPKLDMIIKHIEQFAPILNKYPDTITAIEFGLIGPWGEMHSSTMTTTDNINKLIDTYLNNTHQFPVLVRTPTVIYNYLGITMDDIDSFTITGDSNAYRLGLYNDGYLGNSTDLNTYKNREKEILWLAKQTSHLPYGGEVVVPDSPLHNIENCIPEMELIHLSYLNKCWNNKVIDKWKQTYYSSTVGDNTIYYDISAYEYIENHLGYRFVLENSLFEYSDSLLNIKINLDIKNVGFGNLNRTKQMTLLFVDSNGNIIDFDAGIFSGEPEIQIDIPVDIPSGNYKVYLKIDNGNDQYPLRFANNLWNNDLRANQIGSLTKKPD